MAAAVALNLKWLKVYAKKEGSRKGMSVLWNRSNRSVQVIASFSQPLQQHASFSTAPHTRSKPVEPTPVSSGGFLDSTASPAFTNRWLMVLPAFGTHLCLGAPYAWSLMADVCTREIGLVAPAAADWTLMETALPLSLVFVMHGVGATLFGKWQIKAGVRTALAASAVAFGGGLMLGAAGIHYHSLPLLYAGYGFMGGSGIGLGYTPPVQTLMQWFPDKKGIASGLTIAGFGSGALFFIPSVQYLMKQFQQMPDYLGTAEKVVTKAMDGKIFADLDGKLIEVVNVGASELAKLPYSGLSEGFYAVGTGSTGASEALAIMGAGYFSVIMLSALCIRNPHPSYVVPGMEASSSASSSALAKIPDVTVDDTMKTPQFHLLGATLFCVGTAGMGLLSVAKPMMSEVFSTLLPALVTSAFASKFLLMLSAGNLGGRLGWAAVSDAIGRRNTFFIFTLGSAPLYFALPTIIDTVVSTGTPEPLYIFCASTVAAISMFGGAYAILPAYEADLFGTKYVGAIHGRMLLYSSTAALAGPVLLNKMRAISEKTAITDLMSKISPAEFQKAFGAPMEQADTLMAAKSLSISKLMVLVPPGTPDPMPHLYDTSMYAYAGLMTAAVVAHALVRPMPRLIEVSPTGPAVIKEEIVGDRQINK